MGGFRLSLVFLIIAVSIFNLSTLIKSSICSEGDRNFIDERESQWICKCDHYNILLWIKKGSGWQARTRMVPRRWPWPSQWQCEWKLSMSKRTVNGGLYAFTVVLLMSGDVEIHPGPVQNPCGICDQSVRVNQMAICCDSCNTWSHRRCTDRTGNSEQDWFCNRCILPPFSNSFFDESTAVNEDECNAVVPSTPIVTLPPVAHDPYQALWSKGLSFVHVNARSILLKNDELHTLAASTKVAAIGVTETWLDTSVSDSEITIPGYLITRQDCNREGGGVWRYIHCDITFNPKQDIGAGPESVWVELFMSKSKPILLGMCYRPPKRMDFNNKLEQQCLGCSDFSGSECILLGDFNTDYTCINSLNRSHLHESLIHFQCLFNLTQLIAEPTRITPKTASLLDLILVSDPNKFSGCGVIDVGISKHLLTYCTRCSKKASVSQHQGVNLQSLKNYTKD